MKRIIKLIGLEFINNLIIIYLVFFTVGFVLDFFDKIDEVYSLKLNTVDTISFFLLRSPYIISQINIYALLITAFVTINILIQHNEILTLLTSGVKPSRILTIFATFIIIVNIFITISNLILTPKLLMKSEQKLHTKLSAKDFTNYSDIFIRHKDGFIFIDLILPKGNYLINTYFVKINENFEIEDVYYARVLEKKGNSWIATDGKWISLKNNKFEFNYPYTFSELEILKNISKTTYHPDWLTLNDLIKIITIGKKTGMDIIPYYYQLTRKLGYFIYPILLLYLFFPLTINLGRAKKNKEVIFLGLIFILIFSILETLIFRISQSNGVNPLLPILTLMFLTILLGFFIRKYNYLYKKV